MYHMCLTIHLLNKGHLGCFQFGVIRNKPGISVHRYVLVDMFLNQPGNYHIVILYLAYKELPNTLPMELYHFAFL